MRDGISANNGRADSSIATRLPGGITAPSRARRWLLSELEGQLDGQLTESRAADIAIVVSELVTNSVVHADVGPEQTLTVEWAIAPGRLRIIVTDPGAVTEPELLPPDHKTVGGCGLQIVDELSSAWGVERDRDGRTTVWSELPLDGVREVIRRQGDPSPR